MQKIKIEGNHILTGEIKISGAKNSAVALIPAAILCDETVTITNIPDITDCKALNEILEYLGAKVITKEDTMEIDCSSIQNKEIPEEISKKLRASYYVMGALLGKYKKVNMYFPGGCNIGARPIDQTLKGFKALGATIIEEDNKYTIYANTLKGGHVYLDMPSVGATINTILVAVKAEGETIIENAAKEPEIVNVTTFLNNMGAKITGAGTSQIRIIGVNHLKSCFAEIIPDRIEAGTYVLAGALMGEKLTVKNIIPEHLETLLLKLKEMGVDLNVGDDYVTISKGDNMRAVNIKTLGYPGFATDLQQPITVLLTKCDGESILEETIYENRFKNVPYLNEMGANIELIDIHKIKIKGPTKLHGCEVSATDLRAGACMILAALTAEGITTILEAEHLLRGYEGIVDKLKSVGAKISLEEI